MLLVVFEIGNNHKGNLLGVRAFVCVCVCSQIPKKLSQSACLMRWCFIWVFKSSYEYVVGIGIYKTHFYFLAVEACFYSDEVQCLPLDPRFDSPLGHVGFSCTM